MDLREYLKMRVRYRIEDFQDANWLPECLRPTKGPDAPEVQTYVPGSIERACRNPEEAKGEGPRPGYHGSVFTTSPDDKYPIKYSAYPFDPLG